MIEWRAKAALSVREHRGILMERVAQFVAFEVFFALLALVLFTPLSAWMGAAIISWSGGGAVSNYDLTSFFLSPKGWLFVAITATLGAAIFFFQTGGLMVIAAAAIEGERIRLVGLLRYLVVRFPELLRLGLRIFGVLVLVLLPFLAVVGGCYALFLTESDINYYLEVKPKEFWLAFGISGVAGVICAVVALRILSRWLLAVPALIFEGKAPRAALQRSRELVGADWVRVMGLLIGWGMLVGLLAGVVFVSSRLIRWVLLFLAGSNVGVTMALTGVVLAVDLVLAVAINVVAVVTFSIFVVRFFRERTGELKIPERERLRNEKWVDSAGGGMAVRGWIWVVMGVLVIATGVLCHRMLNAIEVDDTVAITAHRGSSVVAPENTMAAIRQAIEDGSDYVEIDVQRTVDGALILTHDKDMKRVSGVARNVSDMTFEEIRQLDVGSFFGAEFADERVPTLQEVIAVAEEGGVQLNIELKFSGKDLVMAGEVAELVKEKGFDDRCVVTSLDYAGVMEVEKRDPSLRTGLIVTASIGDVTRLEVDLLSVSAGAVSRDLIDRARRSGKEVHVWTVNEVGGMNTMIHMTVDNIITDRPEVLVELLETRAKMSNAEKALLRLGDFLEGRL